MEYDQYLIVSGFANSKVIKPKGKGSVHLSLRGQYTSVKEAQKAIDRLNIELQSKKRRVSNGKKESTD
jgi:hypothetical protein